METQLSRRRNQLHTVKPLQVCNSVLWLNRNTLAMSVRAT